MSVDGDSAVRIVVTGRVQGVGFRAWTVARGARGAGCAAGCATGATAASKRC